ncbi:MAG: hypothetical protein R2911_40455 [Caldilineaceae bacterium]
MWRGAAAQLHPLIILSLGGGVGLAVYVVASLLILRRTPVQLVRELMQCWQRWERWRIIGIKT